jgi:hypothetical protein
LHALLHADKTRSSQGEDGKIQEIKESGGNAE